MDSMRSTEAISDPKEARVDNQRLVNPDLLKEYDGPDKTGLTILLITALFGVVYYCLYVFSIRPERMFVTGYEEVYRISSERTEGQKERYFKFGVNVLCIDSNDCESISRDIYGMFRDDLQKKQGRKLEVEVKHAVCLNCVEYTHQLDERKLNIVVDGETRDGTWNYGDMAWETDRSAGFKKRLREMSLTYSNIVKSVYSRNVPNLYSSEPLTQHFSLQNMHNKPIKWSSDVPVKVNAALYTQQPFLPMRTVFVTQQVTTKVSNGLMGASAEELTDLLTALPAVTSLYDSKLYTVRVLVSDRVRAPPVITENPAGAIVMSDGDIDTAISLALEQQRDFYGIPVIHASNTRTVAPSSSVATGWQAVLIMNAQEAAYLDHLRDQLSIQSKVIELNSQVGFSAEQSVALEMVHQCFVTDTCDNWGKYLVVLNKILTGLNSQTHIPLDRLVATLSPLLAPLIVPILTALVKTLKSCVKRRKSS